MMARDPTTLVAVLFAMLASGAAGAMSMADVMNMSASGALGRHVLFELDAAAMAGGAYAPADVAAEVASVAGCTLDVPKRVFRDAGKFEARHREYGLDLWWKVLCAEEAGNATDTNQTVDGFAKLMQEMEANRNPVLAMVRDAEPEVPGALTQLPNDPLLPSQMTHFEMIRLLPAWQYEKGNEKVVVQVVDSGLTQTHPDLTQNLWKNPGEICGNGVDDDLNGLVDDCNGYNFADDSGVDLFGGSNHGSQCAGIISASSNNGVGIAGIAGGDGAVDGVQLMTTLGFGRFGVGGFEEAFAYAADMGADISSNSWGYTSPFVFPRSVQLAIDYVNAVADTAVVFSAGNNGFDLPRFPGSYDLVTSVASVDDDRTRSSFSNYHESVDVAAPGRNVFTTSAFGYGFATGTSFSCPIVSGVLALGLSLARTANNYDIKPKDVLACALSTTQPLPDKDLPQGMIDAEATLACVASKLKVMSPPPTAAPTFATPAPSAALEY